MNALARRRFFIAGGSAVASATIFPQAVMAAPEFSWKLGHDVPTSHPIGVGAVQLAAMVKQESRGRMEIQVFPANQLGSDASMIVQLRTGSLQMNLQGAGPLTAIVPAAAIPLVGFLFTETKAAQAAWDGGVGELIRAGLTKLGLIGFEKSWANGFRHIVNGTRPIRTAADFAGLKLRVIASPTSTDLFRAFGASPVSMDIAEIYTGMQTKLLDGADATISNVYTYRFYEVQKYLSLTKHQWSGYYMCLNGAAFQSLPPDLQQIVRRASNLIGTRESRAIELQETAIEDLLVRLGMVRNQADTSTFRARLAGYYQHWKQEFGSTAWDTLERYAGKLG